MNQDVCKQCGERPTQFMYRLNDGLYCEKDWEAAHMLQLTALEREAFVEKMKLIRQIPYVFFS